MGGTITKLNLDFSDKFTSFISFHNSYNRFSVLFKLVSLKLFLRCELCVFPELLTTYNSWAQQNPLFIYSLTPIFIYFIYFFKKEILNVKFNIAKRNYLSPISILSNSQKQSFHSKWLHSRYASLLSWNWNINIKFYLVQA